MDKNVGEQRKWAENQAKQPMVVFVSSEGEGEGTEVGINMTKAVDVAFKEKTIDVAMFQSRIFLTQEEYIKFYELAYLLDNFFNVTITNAQGVQFKLSEKDRELLAKLGITTTEDSIIVFPEQNKNAQFINELFDAITTVEFQA